MAFLGKQLVYHAVQDPADAMSLEDLAAMDKEIATLRDTIATSKANEKLLRANLISVNATMSTDELRNSVILLEHDKKELLRRLGSLRSGNVKPVLPEEKEAVDREWTQWSRKAAVRKKICLELWEICTEEVPEGKTKEELWVCIIDCFLIPGWKSLKLGVCRKIGVLKVMTTRTMLDSWDVAVALGMGW